MPKDKQKARAAAGGIDSGVMAAFGILGSQPPPSAATQVNHPPRDLPAPRLAITRHTARREIMEYLRQVIFEMLKLSNYEPWAAEAKGDCGFLSFLAGHEIKEKAQVSHPSAANRMLLVTKGCRKAGFELLHKGVGPGGDAMWDSEMLNSIARRLCGVDTTPISREKVRS